MDIIFWLALGLFVVGYVMNVVRKTRQSVLNTTGEQSTREEDVMEESNIETEDALYNSYFEDSRKMNSMQQSEVEKSTLYKNQGDCALENADESWFDLRQAVISQTILQNDYTDNLKY